MKGSRDDVDNIISINILFYKSTLLTTKPTKSSNAWKKLRTVLCLSRFCKLLIDNYFDNDKFSLVKISFIHTVSLNHRQ